MTVEQVSKLFAYNRWANDGILKTSGELTSDEFTRHFPVSFGSIHAKLTHILGVEWLYLQRWAGTSPPKLPSVDQFPDFNGLVEYWQAIVSLQDSFLAALSEAKLQEPITYINLSGKPFTYRLSDMVQHMVNHSTYHRGQVVDLLRMLNQKPLSTDYLLFLDEQGQ